MRAGNETIGRGLASIDPLAGEDLYQLASETGSDELLAAILATAAKGVGHRPRRTMRSVSLSLRTGRRRRLLVAAPVAAIALVASIVGIPGGGNGSPETLPALARVAEAAAAQPAPDADLPYLYVKTREVNTDTSVAGGQAWSVFDYSTSEEWIAKDGSGRVRRVMAPPRWVSRANRKAWEAAGRINFLAYGWHAHSEEEEVPAGHFDDRLFDGPKLSALPTDPVQLAAWLEDRVTDPKANAGAGNGFPVSVRTLTVTAELLSNPLASPDLRAALYEAEGLVPGIEDFGATTDAIGRHGIAVGTESSNSGAPTRYSLIFDPTTSQVLATEQTRLGGEEASPIPITEAKLFIDSGATSSLHGKPQD